MTGADETRAVAALVVMANRLGSEERADLLPSGPSADDDREGLRIAHDHGIDPLRITAYRGLARSRGLTLE